MRLPEYDEISGTFDTGQRLGKQKKAGKINTVSSGLPVGCGYLLSGVSATLC